MAVRFGLQTLRLPSKPSIKTFFAVCASQGSSKFSFIYSSVPHKRTFRMMFCAWVTNVCRQA
jgi:hypothetical protein